MEQSHIRHGASPSSGMALGVMISLAMWTMLTVMRLYL